MSHRRGLQVVSSSGRRIHRWVRAAEVAGLALLCLSIAAIAQTGELRTWTAANGGHKTEAELVRVDQNGTVVLKKKNGSVVEIPLSKLSQADRKYVQSQGTAVTANKPSVSAGKGTIAEKKPSAGGKVAATGEKPAGTSSIKTLEEVEAEAQKCRTAKEAVLVYKFFLSNTKLTSAQRAEAEKNLETWKARADADLVRLGTEWLKQEEADKIREKAEAKIDYAMELLRLRNGDLARQTLEEASKIDPDSIKADFLIGVVYGLVANNDKKASVHFQKCLDREPGNVSVLNNLAISMLYQKKYVEAAKHWKAAATSAPKYQPLSQNIGSLLTLAGTGGAKLPAKSHKELASLYEELITTHGNPRLGKVAFVYTPPYGSDWDGKKNGSKGKGSGGGKTESVIVSSGSGFVVHPHIILTNRHVIDNASGILVLDPKNPKGEPLPAQLIATAKDSDLALVRCDALDAPAVKLVDTLPPRGSDIMVLGYPLGPSFGTALKSTRGAMVAMPDASVDNMCLYDAVTNPGNSGGPLCDKSGRVAAVVRAVTGGIGGSYGAAIPISEALPFIRQHVPDLAAPVSTAAELGWPEVDAEVAPSTVLIMIKEDLQTNAGIGDGKR